MPHVRRYYASFAVMLAVFFIGMALWISGGISAQHHINPILTAQPVATNYIRACVQGWTGDVNIRLNPLSACKPGEVLVTWPAEYPPAPGLGAPCAQGYVWRLFDQTDPFGIDYRTYLCAQRTNPE